MQGGGELIEGAQYSLPPALNMVYCRERHVQLLLCKSALLLEIEELRVHGGRPDGRGRESQTILPGEGLVSSVS